MSSPKSVSQKSLEKNTELSPVKEFDKSYDSRESVTNQTPEKSNPTPKQSAQSVKSEQSAPQNTEEPVSQATESRSPETITPEVKDAQEKKKKKKVVKKVEETSEAGSDGTATFAKVSTERKGELADNNETNRAEALENVNSADKAAAETKPKKKKKQVAENTEAVSQQDAAADQEEKPKKTKKKVVEKKEEPPVPVVEAKIESPVESTQPKTKTVKKIQKTEEPVTVVIVEQTVQKAQKTSFKNEKPQEVVVSVVVDPKQKVNKAEPENKRPQSKQETKGNSKNLQVVEPTATKSPLVNALVSPTQLAGKMNITKQNNTSATPKAQETEPRYTKNTLQTQARDEDRERTTAYSRGNNLSVLPGNINLKTSPAQDEISVASSPKAKLGPIRSKIETGLGNIRAASKKADTSEISVPVVDVPTKNRTSKSIAKPRGLGQKSQGDLTATHKSYILESIGTHSEMKNKRKGNPRMKSFDAGKTDKIKADDSFETRSKVWQIRKAEKLLEEEKKRTRQQLETCTFNPKVNKRVLPPELSSSTIYERSVLWTEKVNSAVTAKKEEIFETATKPQPKKPRVKSFSGLQNDMRSSKICIEGFTGPQFGVPKTMNVPALSQEPLEFKGNLEEKVNQICDMYECVSSVLKAKSVKNASKSAIKEKPQPKNDNSKSVSRISTANPKERSVKAEPVAVPVTAAAANSKVDEQRLSSLRGILQLNSKEKKSPAVVKKDETQKAVTGEGEANRVPQKSNQRVEIRNNRYVVIEDDNHDISAIEKDTNYDVSVNFDVSTTQHAF